MKIISWNVNGLRAVHKKGFLKWLARIDSEIICLQEIKAQPQQLPQELVKPTNYHPFFHSAIKKGYSGVLVYSKKKPLSIKRGIGFKRFDQEGRFIQLNYRHFSLINLYLPHGQRDKSKLAYKLEAYSRVLKYLRNFKNQKTILVGDFNVARQEIDLARPGQNQNNTMFTLEERKQIEQIIDMDFTDSFRKFHPEGGHYTWWPYTHSARERNLGWRLDYIFTGKKITPKIKEASILKEVNLSDHCPIKIILEKK